MAAKSKSSRPRIAVIGAGSLSTRYHLPSVARLARSGRCDFAALCDINEHAAAKAAKKFGAQAVYHDFQAMLRAEKPDGVIVIVPIPATKAVAGAVLRAGYPVLMEKPPGASSRECRALIRAARIGRALNAVAFNRRHCPVLVQGREAVRKRGAVKGASGLMYRHGRRDERFILGTGIHALDALRFLGGEIERVETDRRVLAPGERPAFTLRIGYAGGAAGTLSVRPQAGVQIERYELFGAQCAAFVRAGVGWLLDRPGSCELIEEGKRARLPDPLRIFKKKRFKGRLYEAACGGFYGEDAAFVEALHRGVRGARLSPSVEESLPSVELAEAVQVGRNWKRRR